MAKVYVLNGAYSEDILGAFDNPFTMYKYFIKHFRQKYVHFKDTCPPKTADDILYYFAARGFTVDELDVITKKTII